MGQMIDLFFVGPNVFNVLKYMVMSLTLGFAADILLDSIYAYNTARNLVRRGWAHPAGSSFQFRFKRGIRIGRSLGNLFVFLTVLVISVAEMALEFSTGAESVWTSRVETLRVSKNASNITSLLRGGPDYILRMENALQRVENICFNTEEMWYFPVFFNMTGENRYQKLGKAAQCLQNYSKPVDAKKALNKSGFAAEEVAITNMWNNSQLDIGLDVNEEEVAVPYMKVKNSSKNARIGALEFYSFLAVNFTSNERPINGSERALSGISTTKRTPVALYTARYRVAMGRSIECLVRMQWKKEEETGLLKRKRPLVDVCLVPISGNRGVLGYFSRNQLVMSVALDRAKTFHDLEVLRATAWMLGETAGLHTYRELAVLTTISSRMVQNINIDGYEDLEFEVGDRHLTVPTWTVWGILLFAFCLIVLVLAKVCLTVWIRQFKIRGNLGTAKGIAESWLLRNEQLESYSATGGEVILALENWPEDERPRVTVKRDIEFQEKPEYVPVLGTLKDGNG